MQQSIIEAHPEAEIEILVVWSAIMGPDSRDRAVVHAAKMRDPRVTQFWDSEALVGRALARALPVGDAPFAWDVYLFYGAEARWGDAPPEPLSWSHQLAGADREHFFAGRLAGKLAEDMGRIFGGEGM